jgi:hypothetical protein
MRSIRSTFAAFLALLVWLLAACSDATTSVMPPPPPPPPPASVAVAYCAGLEPMWVAFQDGDGAWTRALPTTSNGNVVFQATIASVRGGIATVFQGGVGLTSLQVLFGTPGELESVGVTNPRFCGPATVKSLRGSVAGLDTNEFAIIRGGFEAEAIAYRATGGEFSLQVLPPGPQDILATRVVRTNGIDTIPQMILRRGIDLPDAATLPVLDFRTAEAFAPQVANVSLSGIGVGGAAISTRLITSTFNSTFGIVTGQDIGTTKAYYAVPEARLLPGDLQELFASGHGATPNSLRSAGRFFHAVQDYTLALGADVVPPTFSTIATLPTLRLRARFVNQSEYGLRTSVTYQEDSTRLVSVSMTQDYALQASGVYDLVIPELTEVAGFQPRWALSQGSALRWSAVRAGGTLDLGFDVVPFDGATRRTAFVSDVLTP